MDVQNFRMLQNFKFKEQNFKETLHKQKSILQQQRIEYESLKNDEEVKTTPAEKLKQKKNLRSIYTFKLPVNKQKNKEGIETTERFRNGWIQRPLSELPRKIQDLNNKRSRMIELGNSYSENNKKCPLATKTIRRAKSQQAMKYEMLNRAKMLGNHYSFRFRQHHPLKVYKKSIDSYKKHECLINQKNEMEESFKSGEELPQIFPQKYLHVLNEIYRLEEELNLDHQFSDGKYCQEILQADSSGDQRLIYQLSYPIFDNFDVVSDKIEMERAMERIDIETILKATNIVEQRMSKVFWSRDKIDEETETNLGMVFWKNEKLESNEEKMDLIHEADASDNEVGSSNDEINLESVKIDLSNEKIDSENLKIDSKSAELKFEDSVNQNQIETESLNIDNESEDVVIENEEIVYINENFQSKNIELDLKAENLTRNDFFTFKNLILDISEQAIRSIKEKPTITCFTSPKNSQSETQASTDIIDSSPDTAITLSPIFSQKLDSKLTETLKIFCENYIEDLYDFQNIPKHHPSFEDIRIKFIHETTSNVDAGQENDDSQEIPQVSHEICKSQSSILRTQNVESSKLLKMTNDARLNENFITHSSLKDETSCDYNSYDCCNFNYIFKGNDGKWHY